jgi:hypothetical protein
MLVFQQLFTFLKHAGPSRPQAKANDMFKVLVSLMAIVI